MVAYACAFSLFFIYTIACMIPRGGGGGGGTLIFLYIRRIGLFWGVQNF